MTEVLPGVHAARTDGRITVQVCEHGNPAPFYRLTLDSSIPDRDMWFVFAEAHHKRLASSGLCASFSAVPDPLGWARKWIISEDWIPA